MNEAIRTAKPEQEIILLTDANSSYPADIHFINESYDLGADRMNQIAERFLTEINNLGGKTLDKFRLKLSFNVELEE